MTTSTKHHHSIYESLFENCHAIMLIIRPKTGEILDANYSAADFYQYSRQELRQMNISDINIQSKKRSKKKLNNANNKNHNFDLCQHQLKSGEQKDVEVYSGPVQIDKETVLYSIIHDITEKKQVENALKGRKQTIKAMINATKSLVYLVDVEGNIINLNRQGAQIFNKLPKEMLNRNFIEFLTHSDRDRLNKVIETIIQTREPINYQREKDGKTLDVNLYPIVNKEDQVDQICAFVHDVTEIKKTEKILTAVETAG
ncbi:MAG: PAS domain S-box protein, partial [Desulfobacteraceae bacterium]|nr:PAS domain S-box protein [Desulfobacteraceae bacterium]